MDIFHNKFDALVMLTWSDWFSEMRSNRFHYASRFQENLPVYFVQPDLIAKTSFIEKTELKNIYVIHVHNTYGSEQTAILRDRLESLGVKNPLLWIYNFNFHQFIASLRSPLKIMHATEDYFSAGFYTDKSIDRFKLTLEQVDLTVAVSEGVAENVRRNAPQAETSVITNGCDYKFWHQALPLFEERRAEQRILYQGGIHKKIDLDLLHYLTDFFPKNPFVFCGEAYFEDDQKWRRLIKKKNVKYLGKLTSKEVQHQTSQALIGIIPFVQTDIITERSFPLKAFEYLAAGAQVVSVPIKALIPYADHFYFAGTNEKFAGQIRKILETSVSLLEKSQLENFEAAELQDYDHKFSALVKIINDFKTKRIGAEAEAMEMEHLPVRESKLIKFVTFVSQALPFKKTAVHNSILRILKLISKVCPLKFE